MKRSLSMNNPCIHGETSHDVIRDMISSNVDINAQDDNGYTALHLCKDIDTMKLLFELKADPNICDYAGNTPLHSIKVDDNNSIDIIKLYLSYNADVTIYNNQSKTPLRHLYGDSYDNNMIIFKYIVENKYIDPNQSVYPYNNQNNSIQFQNYTPGNNNNNNNNYTENNGGFNHKIPYKPLYFDYLDPFTTSGLQILLENNADLTLHNSDQQIAFDIADNAQTALLLLEYKSPIVNPHTSSTARLTSGQSSSSSLYFTSQINKNRSPMERWLDYPDILYKMIELNADTTWIPSSRVIRCYHPTKTIQLFLKYKVDPWSDNSPPPRTAHRQRGGRVSPVQQPNNANCSLLMHDCTYDLINAVITCLRDDYSNTPEQISQYLNLIDYNNDNETALFRVHDHNIDAIILLLQHGADPLHINSDKLCIIHDIYAHVLSWTYTQLCSLLYMLIPLSIDTSDDNNDITPANALQSLVTSVYCCFPLIYHEGRGEDKSNNSTIEPERNRMISKTWILLSHGYTIPLSSPHISKKKKIKDDHNYSTTATYDIYTSLLCDTHGYIPPY